MSEQHDKWELVGPGTERLSIPLGWLYRVTTKTWDSVSDEDTINVSVVFVSTPECER